MVKCFPYYLTHSLAKSQIQEDVTVFAASVIYKLILGKMDISKYYEKPDLLKKRIKLHESIFGAYNRYEIFNLVEGHTLVLLSTIKHITGLDKTGRPDPRLPPLMPKDRKLKKDDILSAQAKLKLEKEQNLQYLQNLHGKSVFSLSRSKREATQSLFEEDENVITLGITHDLQFFYE